MQDANIGATIWRIPISLYVPLWNASIQLATNDLPSSALLLSPLDDTDPTFFCLHSALLSQATLVTHCFCRFRAPRPCRIDSLDYDVHVTSWLVRLTKTQQQKIFNTILHSCRQSTVEFVADWCVEVGLSIQPIAVQLTYWSSSTKTERLPAAIEAAKPVRSKHHKDNLDKDRKIRRSSLCLHIFYSWRFAFSDNRGGIQKAKLGYYYPPNFQYRLLDTRRPFIDTFAHVTLPFCSYHYQSNMMQSPTTRSLVLAMVLIISQGDMSSAFQQKQFSRFGLIRRDTASSPPAVAVLYSTETSNDAAFSAFADALEEGEEQDDQQAYSSSSSSSTNGKSQAQNKSWQTKLEDLLDPATNMGDRQMLLTELLSSNEAIRESVLDALAKREVRNVLQSSSIFFAICICFRNN